MRRYAKDPTRQARNRKKADKALRHRLRRARARVLEMFQALPYSFHYVEPLATNARTTHYTYEMDAAIVQARIAEILNTELLGGASSVGWYWQPRVEQPYRQGTIAGVTQVSRDVGAQRMVGTTVEQALLSGSYRTALAEEVADSFRVISGLSDDTSRRLYTVINQGVRGGLGPRQIASAIRERFGVAESNATRIAVTEVNQAYTNASMRAVEQTAAQLNVRAGVFHLSALIPTTREPHAHRHGRAYTVEQQMAWWALGANRINCHCSVEAAVLDEDGTPVNRKLQAALVEERALWAPD